MAERQLSGKDLLDQLYRGLDTVQPNAVEAELDAHELLGIAPVRSAEPASAKAFASKKAAPASRAKLMRAPLMIVCGVAVAGAIAAAVLHQSEPDIQPVAMVVTLPPPDPLPMQVVNLAPAQPEVVLSNPFDPSEKFTFPPGTSKAEAREQMASLLLQRAVDRKAHVPRNRNRKLASDQVKTATGRGS
jgi:hypothetical protein